MTDRLIIVLLGKQGAGKGTQADLLSKHYGIPHVSTGEILRAAIKAGSELGQRVKGVLDAGELVSDELVNDLVEERFAQPDAARGVLLDGYPRTVGQADALAAMLLPNTVTACINLDVATDLVTERLAMRRVCKACSAIYRSIDPSGETGVCERCGGEVVQRGDDTPEAIRQRLSVYERDTAPLLDYYSTRDLLITINGDDSVDNVFAAITAAVDEA